MEIITNSTELREVSEIKFMRAGKHLGTCVLCGIVKNIIAEESY